MVDVLAAIVTTVVVALIVWATVYAARHTDEPWWKVWLLGRGLFPTAKDIRQMNREDNPLDGSIR